MRACFAEHLRPVEGARELLESLALPVYIASNGPREKTQDSLRACGLNHFFNQENAIFSAYEFGVWKPAPAFYATVVSRLGLRPGEAIVVEDSCSGIRSAIGAGIRRWHLHHRARLREFPARRTQLGAAGPERGAGRKDHR